MTREAQMNVQPGTLLVAAQWLRDPGFGGGVFLILAQTSTGFIGVNLAELSEEDSSGIQVGGPLREEQVIIIHKKRWFTGGFCIGETGHAWRTSPAFLAKVLLKLGLTEVAVYGYAGWDDEQLQYEIGQDAWLPTDVSLVNLLALPVDRRWQAAFDGAARVVSSQMK